MAENFPYSKRTKYPRIRRNVEEFINSVKENELLVENDQNEDNSLYFKNIELNNVLKEAVDHSDDLTEPEFHCESIDF